MKIKEIMSGNPIVVEAPGTRKDAIRVLARHNVSGAPVVKAGTKKLVGVVTRNDLFEKLDEDQLALIMSSEPFTIEANEDIAVAAKYLHENRIHGLPVVTKEKELVGIVSPLDILGTIAKDEKAVVDDYMTKNCVPIYEETPISLAMAIISITDVNALPVLNAEGSLVGVVTDGDILQVSHIREGIAQSELGMGDDEDSWTWEGVRDTMRLYYATSHIKLPDVTVKEVMVRNVVSVFRKNSISEAAIKMRKNNITQLPVVDENNKLVSMIYDTDLLRALI
ncbi:MAG: hypothetical protein CVT48_04595 [Thermoplasmata archaeon HGW-Thermoplasmata-1]|nr:MAG: hypothetical protein CVT48_04595 [Thermoplasmata archaeon HGW-Thermoplasmata-1]